MLLDATTLAALTPLIGVKALVPVLAVAGIIINAGRFWFYRSNLDRRALGVVLASALPFLVFGTWLYSMKSRAVVLTTPGIALGCGVFGLASGVATGTGVILVSILLGARLSGPAVLATDALATIALDLYKAALFQRFDLLDSQAFFTGVLIGVATIPGSALAAWLVHRLGAKLHVLFMEALILAGGGFMLWHSWR